MERYLLHIMQSARHPSRVLPVDTLTMNVRTHSPKLLSILGISVSKIFRIWYNKMTYCHNLCKLRTKVLCTSMFIGHLYCFSKLLVCVLVPFSYPISMFFLFILKISLYMWINRLFMLCATLLFSQVVIFLSALLMFLYCVEVKNFKLPN